MLASFQELLVTLCSLCSLLSSVCMNMLRLLSLKMAAAIPRTPRKLQCTTDPRDCVLGQHSFAVEARYLVPGVHTGLRLPASQRLVNSVP